MSAVPHQIPVTSRDTRLFGPYVSQRREASLKLAGVLRRPGLFSKEK